MRRLRRRPAGAAWETRLAVEQRLPARRAAVAQSIWCLEAALTYRRWSRAAALSRQVLVKFTYPITKLQQRSIRYRGAWGGRGRRRAAPKRPLWCRLPYGLSVVGNGLELTAPLEIHSLLYYSSYKHT